VSVQSTTHKFFSYFYKSHSGGEGENSGAVKSGSTTDPVASGITGREAKEERDFGPSSIREKVKSHYRAHEHRRDFSSFHRAYSRAAEEARFNAENSGPSGPSRQPEREIHRAVSEGFGGLNLRAILTFLHQISAISSQSTNTTGEQLAQVDQGSPVINPDKVTPQETVVATPVASGNVADAEIEIPPVPVAPKEVVLVAPLEAQPQVQNSPLADVAPPQSTTGPVEQIEVVEEAPVIVLNNPAMADTIVEEINEVVAATPAIVPIVTKPAVDEVSEVAPVAPVQVVETRPIQNVGEVFEVSSAAGLQELLSQDISGSTIKLLAGDYVGVNFDGFNPAANVRIVSADVENPTRMAKINITGSSNISFESIEFRADSNSEAYWNQYVVRVSGSDNVQFSGSEFSGGEGMQNSGLIGLYVDSSENVSVKDSEFTNTARGAIFSNTNGIKVEGNNVHNLQTDGFNFVGVTDVLIDKNTFGDFYPQEGDHADYIQFWLVGAKQDTENVTIRNNFMAQSGGDRVQGIFITGTDEFTNKNFVIENNSVFQSGYHGISISSVEDLMIQNNTVISSDDGRDTWIKVGNATNAQILNNITNLVLLDAENTVVSEGNIIAKPDGIRGTAYTDLFKGVLVADSSDPNLFLTLAEINAGADISELFWELEDQAAG